MQFETYISDLLYRYDCVTIPEFGAFLTHRLSAKIEESSHSFYPPKKALSFNEQLQHNDGLLSNYIAEVEKIPYDVALQKVAKYVKSIKSYLIQGETITFSNIGELVLNNEGKINFEPSYHVNYLTDAFGLSQFSSPSIKREEYKKDVETIEKVIPITITPEKRKSRPYLKYAAIALIALTLGGFTASNYYINQIEAQNEMAQEEANQQLDTRVQEATFVISNPLPAATLNIEKQSGKYHIVAGAFRIEANSDKKVKQLQELGYKARKIGANKYGLHEVVYSSYEDRVEALKALRTIKREHNPDAWLKVASNLKSSQSSPAINYTTTTNQRSNTSLNHGKIGAKSEDNLPTVSNEGFDITKSPNLIKILHNVNTVESGFYTVLGTFSDLDKRDEFLTNLKSRGVTDFGFFVDPVSNNYIIYHQKFDDVNDALKALQSEGNSYYSSEMPIVKVEN